MTAAAVAEAAKAEDYAALLLGWTAHRALRAADSELLGQVWPPHRMHVALRIWKAYAAGMTSRSSVAVHTTLSSHLQLRGASGEHTRMVRNGS